MPLLQHFLTGQTPRFDYDFDVMSRRKLEQRDSGAADGFRYDLSGQVTGFNRNGTRQSDGTVAGGANVLTIGYDANGNRQYVSDAAPNANGLSATYFNNDNFTGSTIARVDPNVNFTWNAGSPHPAIGPDTFSARWEGQVVPRFSETYTFYTQSDDGVRLGVRGQAANLDSRVIAQGWDSADKRVSFRISLSPAVALLKKTTSAILKTTEAGARF